MAAPAEISRVEYHFPLLKEGEVSPCKLLVVILIREYFTHTEFKPSTPEYRTDLAFFTYRLITMKDTTYRGFISLCLTHDHIIAPEIIVSFLRVIDNLDEENPCFITELVTSIIDSMDASQTILLRKSVLKGSPVGKFLRLVLLSIRKMSFPQVSYLYRQFWRFVHAEALDPLHTALQSILPQALTKGFEKLYVQQHQPFVKSQAKPGLDCFNERLRSRASTGKIGLGPSLNRLSVQERTSSCDTSVANASGDPPVLPVPPMTKKLSAVKWHNRKLIERTIRYVCSNFNTTGTPRYTPRKISTFINTIRHNPSSEPMYPQMHFLEYLNSIQIKDYARCTNSLRTTFDLKKKATDGDLNKAYAAYNFALLYAFFGFKEDATTTLNEAFQAAHSVPDQRCLHYCHNLWASMHDVPYKESIVKCQAARRMHKALSFMHSFNVTADAFNVHAEGTSPAEVFKSIWRITTGLDFENTESLSLIAMANLFSILGDNEGVRFVTEVLVNTAHSVRWPLRSFASALVHLGSSYMVRAELVHADAILADYGNRLFKCDGSVAGELYAKHHAICKATKSFLGRKLVDEEVIATIRAFDTLESYYWNAYNQMLRNDWTKAERLIGHLWDSVKVKTPANCEIVLRILILEAEILSANENTTGALQRLFEAHRLAVKLSADFYVMSCQLGICSVQIFLGLPSTAMKSLYSGTLVKCRAACKFLRAKLCTITAKLALHAQFEHDSGQNPATSEMDTVETIELFKASNFTEYKHKQPKISKKSQNENSGDTGEVPRDKTVTKVLSIQEEVYQRLYPSPTELERVKGEIALMPISYSYNLKKVCII